MIRKNAPFLKLVGFSTLSLLGFLPTSFSQMNCSSVIAISGGGAPFSNHLRYYTGLARVQESFAGCPISNFVTSGKEEDKVTMVYNTVGDENPSDPLSEEKKILLDQYGFPVLQPMVPQGGIQGAASHHDILNGLLKTKSVPNFPSKAPVIIYVTDHGSIVKGEGAVVLWDKTYLNPTELNGFLQQIPEEQKIIMLYDQCYGGAMLRAMWDKDGKVRKNTCGLAAADAGQLAYNTGGIMRNLNRVVSHPDEDPANTWNVKAKDLTYEGLFHLLDKDTEITSTPVRSSEVFAQKWFEGIQKKKFPDFTLDANFFNHIVSPEQLCLTSGHSFSPKQTAKEENEEKEKQMILKKIKQTWNAIHSDYKKYVLGSSLKSIMQDLKNKDHQRQKSERELEEFKVNILNPHLIKLSEKNYPSFAKYLTLKEKLNQGLTLSEQERYEFRTYEKEMRLLEIGMEEEAKLKVKEANISYKTNPSPETINIFSTKSSLSNRRSADMKRYHVVKRKVTKLVTLNALDRMIFENDLEAMKTYLNILECEQTPLLSQE